MLTLVPVEEPSTRSHATVRIDMTYLAESETLRLGHIRDFLQLEMLQGRIWNFSNPRERYLWGNQVAAGQRAKQNDTV